MLGSLTKLLYSIITDIPICRNMTLTVNCSIPRYVVRTYDTVPRYCFRPLRYQSV